MAAKTKMVVFWFGGGAMFDSLDVPFFSQSTLVFFLKQATWGPRCDLSPIISQEGIERGDVEGITRSLYFKDPVRKPSRETYRSSRLLLLEISFVLHRRAGRGAHSQEGTICPEARDGRRCGGLAAGRGPGGVVAGAVPLAALRRPQRPRDQSVGGAGEQHVWCVATPSRGRGRGRGRLLETSYESPSDAVQVRTPLPFLEQTKNNVIWLLLKLLSVILSEVTDEVPKTRSDFSNLVCNWLPKSSSFLRSSCHRLIFRLQRTSTSWFEYCGSQTLDNFPIRLKFTQRNRFRCIF